MNEFENNIDVEKIMVEYKPLVSKIARRYFIYGEDIDDLMQEGMIGLYKAIKNYDSTKQASFMTFAVICITRQIQTEIRKANSKKNAFLTEMFDEDEKSLDEVSNKENPETNYISNQSYQNIMKEVQSNLSKKELQILNEYLDGLTYDDIAKKLCISKKSVDNALSRIRKKLSFLRENI